MQIRERSNKILTIYLLPISDSYRKLVESIPDPSPTLPADIMKPAVMDLLPSALLADQLAASTAAAVRESGADMGVAWMAILTAAFFMTRAATLLKATTA